MFSVGVTALPVGEQVVHGQVEFVHEDGSLSIKTSNKAVINYDSFSIGERERVNFIQPSSSSSVLNRVVGSDLSSILGKMTSNGKVFLVNPNGIYFGQNASLNMGALIVSTLDILDQNFLDDRFYFQVKEGATPGIIHNLGQITSQEGVVALISPYIKNEGAIIANAGRVCFAAGEAVTLDFTGDGLMSFIIEGDLEKAVIEHLGNIQSGEVFMNLKVANRAIHDVVNMDNIEEGNSIVKENGTIRIVHKGTITANNVHLSSSDKISVEGSIDVSQDSSVGGTVHILGDHIRLTGADINASGNIGGGTVLVGGEYRGEGSFQTAFTNVMDIDSTINADAITAGNGGRVILWAEDATIFNGKISARGGVFSGNGGFVETSGKQRLGVQTGRVDTLAFSGNSGSWLLDPDTITIAGIGMGTLVDAANCADTSSTFVINVSTINGAASNVVLCAATSITQNTGQEIAISTPNVGIEFKASSGTITTTLNDNITTLGSGSVIFTDSDVVLGANVTIDAGGGEITFNNRVDGAHALTLTSTGADTFTGAVGEGVALSSLTVTGGTITQSSTVASSGIVTYTDTTSLAIGGTITAASFSQSGGGSVSLGGSIVSTGVAGVSFGDEITLVDFVSINTSTGGGDITFSSTVNGMQDFSLTAGSGDIILSGVLGGIDPLGAFTVYSANNLTLPEISSCSIMQVAGTGTTILGGIATTTCSEGVSLMSNNISINANINTIGDGQVILKNSGLLSIGVGTIINAGGSFSQRGTGAVSVSGNVNSH